MERYDLRIPRSAEARSESHFNFDFDWVNHVCYLSHNPSDHLNVKYPWKREKKVKIIHEYDTYYSAVLVGRNAYHITIHKFDLYQGLVTLRLVD